MMHAILGQSGSSGGIDIFKILLYAAFAIMFILPAITGKKNKNKKPPLTDAERVERQRRFEELAARRRGELQDTAQQRRGGASSGDNARTSGTMAGSQSSSLSRGGGTSGGASGRGGEPGNLTMAERIARARAKQQYEARTQGIPSAPAPSLPSAKPVPAARRPALPPRSKQSASVTRRPQAGRMEREAAARQKQVEAAAARQRAQVQKQADALAQTRARQQAAAQRKTPQRIQPATTHGSTRPVSQTAIGSRPVHGIGATGEHDQVHRMVTDASDAGTTTRRIAAPLNFARLSRQDLQRAIILKEVLGLPLALRDLPNVPHRD